MSNSAMRRGLLLVVSSPSGAGKTSLSRRLIENNAGQLELSVSATTRAPRPGERDGREYWFKSPADFATMVAEGAFLEWFEVHEHAYGTPRAPVTAHLEAGRDVLFDIDWQGAQAIAAAAPADTVRVFILPPTMADLSERLHSRAQDAEDVIARRLGRAKGEISHWVEYDYVIVNADFERAYADLAAIYRAETLRRARSIGLTDFVDTLLN